MRRVHLKGDWESFDYTTLRVEQKSVCVVRYGAFGDMIQTSSVLPALKEQGYHVTINVIPYGVDVIRNDPHVDCLFVQENEHVPNENLGEYWGKLAQQFDKFINLSESIERSLITVEDEKPFYWHKDFRDLVMGIDYLDATHTIAEVMDYPKRPKFYPNKKEIAWAKEYRAKLGKNNRVILWALSGSSVHKYYPKMDEVIARLMVAHPETIIVMVGDKACVLLEASWINEPRIKRKSGKWSIRETMAFMQQCDVVVGTETGVMNGASFEPMRKVIMLSHSSPKNLGTSWVNTSVVTPENTPCYPCHKLHYGWATCHYDDVSGSALCAANTNPDDVYRAICEAL
jgi:ADP-heptose:LPS heptosyltransferase